MKKWPGYIIIFLSIWIVLWLLSWLPAESLPFQPTGTLTFTPENTATATSTSTFYIARVDFDVPCRFGTSQEYQTITTIPQGRDVVVMGKDGVPPNWILVRWGGFPDCWVEAYYLTSSHISFAVTVSTPLQPSLTPGITPTPTSPPTETITVVPTRTLILPSATRIPRDYPITPIPPPTDPPPTDPPPTDPPPTNPPPPTKTKALPPTNTKAPP